jgi:arylsulfatase A-like enzyme
MDEAMGQILGALQRAGLAENTVVIFTTDHGASFMHSKGTLYDGGVKVACLIRWPEALPGGRRIGAITSHVDLVPTVFDLIGQTLPEDFEQQLEGRSLAGLLYGGSTIERTYAFAEKNYTNYYDPARMVRSDDLKYIRKGLRTCIFDFVIPELELCPSGFRRNRQVFEFYPARRCWEELYDLRQDPAEMNNVAEDPDYREALEEMRGVLDEHLEETSDPFRHLRNVLLMPIEGYEEQRREG